MCFGGVYSIRRRGGASICLPAPVRAWRGKHVREYPYSGAVFSGGITAHTSKQEKSWRDWVLQAAQHRLALSCRPVHGRESVQGTMWIWQLETRNQKHSLDFGQFLAYCFRNPLGAGGCAENLRTWGTGLLYRSCRSLLRGEGEEREIAAPRLPGRRASKRWVYLFERRTPPRQSSGNTCAPGQ